MKRMLGALVLLPCFLGVAFADDEGASFRINLRGGSLAREDSGYLSHAQTFGFDRMDAAGGGVIEAGVELEGLPRWSFWGSYTGFSSRAERRLSTLSLSSDAFLAHVRYAAWRWRSRDRDLWFGTVRPGNLRADLLLSLGAGLYRLHDALDDAQRDTEAAGLRAGADFTIYWRWLGFVMGYAYHYTGAEMADRLGGSVSAGGHEVSAGLALRF